jgi:hypothetical protein
MGSALLLRRVRAAMENIREELERVKRVSDMLATGHAHLKERYDRRALALDIAIIALSLWLTAIAFVDPRLGIKLTPFGIDPQLWVGVLGVFTFLLSIVQLRVDWKRQSDAHRRTCDLYSEVKRECGYLLASDTEVKEEDCRRVLARYGIATDVGTAMPEGEFLRQKRRHVQKIAISRHLDGHPGSSIFLLKFRMWLRDNLTRSDRN